MPSPSHRLETFFELSLSLLCTAAAGENRFDDLNPAWERTLGWSLDELKSRPFTDFIHPDDLQPTFDIIADMVDRGLPAVNFENRYLHKDGRWIWLSWVGSVREGRFYSTAHDITDYKHTLAELQRAHGELAQFAYAASHDLQEPLRAVTGYLGAVRTEGLDERSRRALGHVEQGARHMQHLIDGLVSVSRVGAEARPFKVVSLQHVVDRAVLFLQTSIHDKGALVEIDGSLPTVRGDDVQLIRVFQNVIGNALKYSKADQAPVVRIASSDEGTQWRIDVTDNGIGIAPDRAERAFQMFQRLHPRSQFPGMGVGLALARRIVEHHAGEIWMKGAEGEGVTVSVRLPKVPVPLGTSAGPSSSGAPGREDG